MSFERIRELNKELNIRLVTDPGFKRYGQVLDGYDFQEAMDFVNTLEMPPRHQDIYVQNSAELLGMRIAEKIKNEIYGGMDVDIGYALGIQDSFCGLLEYHRCDEFMVATKEPLILFVGDQRDIVDNCYDLSLLEAFYLPVGLALDLYATSLHGYPCQSGAEGYRMLVALAQNTNNPIDFEIDRTLKETKLLANVNAFVLVQEESEIRAHYPDAFPGLLGASPVLRLE